MNISKDNNSLTKNIYKIAFRSLKTLKLKQKKLQKNWNKKINNPKKKKSKRNLIKKKINLYHKYLKKVETLKLKNNSQERANTNIKIYQSDRSFLPQ